MTDFRVFRAWANRSKGEVESPSANANAPHFIEPAITGPWNDFFAFRDTTWEPPANWSYTTRIVRSPRIFTQSADLTVHVDVWELLTPALSQHVDGWPVTINGKQFVCLRAKAFLDDAIDEELSTCTYFSSSGRLMSVSEFRFRPEVITDPLVFQTNPLRGHLFFTESIAQRTLALLHSADCHELGFFDASCSGGEDPGLMGHKAPPSAFLEADQKRDNGHGAVELEEPISLVFSYPSVEEVPRIVLSAIEQLVDELASETTLSFSITIDETNESFHVGWCPYDEPTPGDWGGVGAMVYPTSPIFGQHDGQASANPDVDWYLVRRNALHRSLSEAQEVGRLSQVKEVWCESLASNRGWALIADTAFPH